MSSCMPASFSTRTHAQRAIKPDTIEVVGRGDVLHQRGVLVGQPTVHSGACLPCHAGCGGTPKASILNALL